MKGWAVSRCKSDVRKRTNTCWPGVHLMIDGTATRTRPLGTSSMVALWMPCIR